MKTLNHHLWLGISMSFYLWLPIHCVQVDITNTPSGIVFKIPDEGFSLVGLHYSINKPVSGVAAGDFNVDITSSRGGNFVHEDQTNHLKVGDTVNYWVLTVSRTNGEGHTLTEQSFLYSEPTTSTTTSTTTATTTSKTVVPSLDNILTNAVTRADLPVGGQATTGSASDNKQPSPGSNTDEFDNLDCKLWEHEITAGGGGNWEFQYYTNNRSNSYVRDGKLFIKPTLTTDRFGPQFPESGHLNIWGSNPTDTCTGNNFYGCERTGMPGQVVNPIQSARLRSSRYFNFKYGRLEVEAKMPNGDWLWPAIWLLPRWNSYGIWPASGEIDLVESRGNANYRDDTGQPAGVESVGSTLHFGPFVEANQWMKAHATKFSVDGQEILAVDPGTKGFWDFGEFEKNGQGKWDNPWAAGGRMAPFDQEFYIIMNVAVGGVGFFPDNYVNSPHPKPWNDNTGHAATAFWNARNNWLPTWKLDQNNGEDAALQVNYVRVWKMTPNN
ncbi:beta-1,3-glucan-binding protein-like [Plakobranchus ocellatus]|uniref:Beta-1,3-glucan-binding protein-like n=1 Tax=Plakobranchus ocellatus TaxID=259542 RepID=A0AAV4C593_9GAST|nr:beta-1,3-glucan-binding protein-like [Plakobranchus ocellatus]